MSDDTEGAGPLIGCDELRAWLIGQGFRVARDDLSRNNECNWYAYRQSAIPSRECEENKGKQMQVVVSPFRLAQSSGVWESAEMDVTGEAGGNWYKIQCYSLTHADLMARLDDIESALIAAWNALEPVQR